jgi:tripartite-type tricarboxylate transporter receptor subunit TctC
VLVVNPANPANSAAAFVAQSKQKTDPTPIASSGVGSMPHLALELFADSTGPICCAFRIKARRRRSPT